MKAYLTVLVALCLTGCLTPASKINAVHLGMTKAEVLAVMGTPSSVTADEHAEYLNYSLAEGMRTGYTATQSPYEVKLVNGKVVSYGRAGTAPTISPGCPQLAGEKTRGWDNRPNRLFFAFFSLVN